MTNAAPPASFTLSLTPEALRGRPGGRNFVIARIIVAMYWRMETWGLDES